MARTPASDDDAALRWDDLDDPSYSDPSLAALSPESVDGGESGEPRAAEGADAPADLERASERRSALETPLTVLFALVYLAYTVGWMLGIGLVPVSGPTLVIEIMYQFSEFLAIIASALWFGAVVALTREGRARYRFGWLALGTLVLLPWPLVLGLLP